MVVDWLLYTADILVKLLPVPNVTTFEYVAVPLTVHISRWSLFTDPEMPLLYSCLLSQLLTSICSLSPSTLILTSIFMLSPAAVFLPLEFLSLLDPTGKRMSKVQRSHLGLGVLFQTCCSRTCVTTMPLTLLFLLLCPGLSWLTR